MPNPPNPQRRSESSRRATLDAALELCAEQGYAQVTVEGIAARAGVSKKTVYRWWPSKGAVVLEAVHDSALRPTIFPDTGDLAADLLTQLSGVIGTLIAPRTRSAVIGVFTAALHDPDLGEQLHREWISPRIEQFRHRLRQAEEQGQVPPGTDPDVIMDLVYGPIFHRLMVHLPLPDAAYLRKVLDSVLPTGRDVWSGRAAVRGDLVLGRRQGEGQLTDPATDDVALFEQHVEPLGHRVRPGVAE